ncbi:MAG: hypothetical protein ACR2KJ_17065 [Jatrophihabitans sp.]
MSLEVGTSRYLTRFAPQVSFEAAPVWARRSGLILIAAHTVFPEADSDGLPAIAREEIASGLAGPLRQALADHQVTEATTVEEALQPDERVLELRDHLILALGADATTTDDALQIASRVHLARAVLGTVPIAVGIGCFPWYAAYVSSASPSSWLFAEAADLLEEWTQRPDERRDIERAMAALARLVVGDDPPDFLDLAI